MLDSFFKRMMSIVKERTLVDVTYYLLRKPYMGNFEVGNMGAACALGKRILEKFAAAGNTDAMSSICYAHVDNEVPKGVVSGAEYLKYAKMLISKKNAAGYYYMGAAYEYGIGVKPSRSTAHSYYAKGREMNDKDCDRGWWRTL